MARLINTKVLVRLANVEWSQFRESAGVPGRPIGTRKDPSMRLPAPLIFVAGLLVAGDAREDEIKKEKGKLTGVWQATSMTAPDGKKLPDELIQATSFVFTAEKFASRVKEDELVAGTYTLDPSSDPRALDIHPKGVNDMPIRCIYELKGDALTMCFGDPGGERPKEFKPDPKKAVIIVVLKREKK